MSFAENLKKARQNVGMTQQQVADRMGITKSTYCGYETEKRQPDVQKIKQLSKILGVPSDFLLETENAPVQKDKRTVSDDDLKAAFFEGANDLTSDEIDALWNDAKDYIQYKIEQRRKKND